MNSNICKRCGKPLSVNKSVERGIGPICINKENTIVKDDQMKIFGNSFIHTFKGFGGCKSQCQVDVIQDNGKTIVVFTDIGVGTSVTNFSEFLATEMINKLSLNPDETLWAERYVHGKEETLDQILYHWDGFKYRKPEWRRIPGMKQLTQNLSPALPLVAKL
jgi:hypothetical protein